jgi:DNA (cytosine-5)-methyltransferase 1
MTFRFIDLFCGMGGFHRALENLGGTCVFASDIDKNCQDTYERNFGLRPVGDIREVKSEDVPDHDVLCGGFPCFVAGTRVLTKEGYKAIETVTLEDELLTHTGEFHSIVNRQRKIYNQNLYKIRIKYHPEPIVCTSEHPFYIREKVRVWNNDLRKYEVSFNAPSWKDAKDLTMNDYLGMVVNTKELIPEFTHRSAVNRTTTIEVSTRLDIPDQWFMMGYFVGDGWVQADQKSDGRLKYLIRFAINNREEESVLRRIQTVLPITDKKCDTGACKKFGCASQEWYSILTQFGHLAHGKRIPEWVQDAPVHLINEFIAGYMKADGYVRSDGMYSITTVSDNLALGMQRLFLKVGKFASISKCVRPKTCVIEGRTVNQRDTYTVRVHHVNRYSSFIENGYAWFAPSTITTSTTENTPVYNFEVDTDNTYIVENTIVHNCQTFSNAGRKAAFEDTRGTLFHEIARIVSVKKPSFLLLENVKHILKVQKGQVFETIMAVFDELGYDMKHVVLSPHLFGVPQKRERVYFMGVRKDLGVASLPPPPQKTKTVILDKKVDKKYNIKPELLEVCKAWDEMLPVLVGTPLGVPIILEYFDEDETAPGMAKWKQTYIRKNKAIYEAHKDTWDAWRETHKEVLAKRKVYAKLEWQAGKIKEGDTVLGGHFLQLRQSGIRVKNATEFPTLVAIVQTSIVGSQKRYLTPRECARLQSFPDTQILPEKDQVSYKQLGNSVNVNVVEHVARHLINPIKTNPEPCTP